MFRKIKSLLLHNHSTGQTVAKNAFWLSFSSFGGRLLRATIIIYGARVLGPSEWGVFNYVITIAAFLTLFVDFGINHILIRERSKDLSPKNVSELTATSLVLKNIFLLFGVLLILFVAPILPAADQFTKEKALVLFPWIAAIVAFDTLREFGFAIIKSKEKMELEALLYIFTNISIVIAGFVLLTVHPTVRGFTFAYAIGTLAGLLLTGGMVWSDIKRVFLDFSKNKVFPILRSAWPFAISGALGMLMINTDIIMLGWWRSSEELGLYSAPQRIIQLLYLAPAVLAASALPLFSRLAHSSQEKMKLVIERMVSASLFIALPTAIGGIIVAPELVPFLFGGKYGGAVLPLQILLITLLIDFSAVILSNAIFAYDHQRSLIVYSALGGFSNVFFNILLIPSFGIAGCALATLLAQAISNAYLQKKMRSLNKIEVLPHLKNSIAATSAMAVFALVAMSLDIPVLITILLSGLIYAGILLKVKEPLIKELQETLRQKQEAHTPPELVSADPT